MCLFVLYKSHDTQEAGMLFANDEHCEIVGHSLIRIKGEALKPYLYGWKNRKYEPTS